MTNNEMKQLLDWQNALTSEAAKIGRETAGLSESLDKAKVRVEAAQGENKLELQRLRKELDGFNAPKYQGLAKLGPAYQAFVTIAANGAMDSQIARDALTMARNNFVSNMTAKTEKSAKGGTGAGYDHTIRLGDAAPRVIAALNNRVRQWESVKEALEAEKKPENACLIADAQRYCQPRNSHKCPAVEGATTTSDGKQPTHNGRPSRTVHGIAIPYMGATTRDAQLAELSRFYAAHGEIVLSNDFIDALLDTGGKCDKPGATVVGEASRALQAIEFLVLNGGQRSTDSAFLSMATVVLNRIASSGFGESQAADAAAFDAAAPEAPAEPVEAGISLGAPDPAPDAGKAASTLATKRKRGGRL